VAEGGGADLQVAQSHRHISSMPPLARYKLNSGQLLKR
jgi:hypothetical protein